MKAKRILSVLLVILLGMTLMGPGPATRAQEGSTEYEDPAGRYSIPVPVNWTVEEHDGYIALVDPDGDLTFSVVVVEGEDAREGIEAAWMVVDPAFDSEPVPGTDQDFPAMNGIDETVVLTYDLGETSGQIVQAIAQRVGTVNYVLLIEGSLDAAVRRNSQVQLIASGFVVGEQDTVDLSGAAPAEFDEEMAETFTTFVDSLLTRGELPGASVVVVQNGEVVFAEGFGVKSLDGSDPVTADTLMMVGSVAKSFTTTMMASMVDEGLFTWDTPVVDILPTFTFSNPELTAEITMRDLVCACTGVPRRDLELIFNANELTAEELILSLADFDVFTEFGEAFQYSNQMVAAGGYIAAYAAGGIYGDLDDGYAQELQRRVLDPSGMERTTLSFINASLDPDVASPHGLNLDGEFHPGSFATEAILEPAKPSGTLWSTANELGNYLIMQLNEGAGLDGEIVASPESLGETRKPAIEVTSTVDYGLGWFVEESKGLQIINHGGNTFGFTSHLAFLPDADLGIAVLINAQAANGFGEALQARLLELVYDLPEEIEAQVDQFLEPAATPVSGETADEDTYGAMPSYDEVASLLGRYADSRLGEIELRWSDAYGLLLDAGEFVSILRPLTGDGAVLGDYILFDGPGIGATITVETSEGGEVQIVISLGTDRYVFEPVEPAPSASPVPAATPEAA